MLINFKKIAIWLLFGLLFVVTVWVDDFSRRRVLSGFDDAAAIMSVYFFDVGQGDAILIRTPAGDDILIDGGPDDTVVKKLGQYLPLGDWQIEYLILTHPDSDHVTGLVETAKRYDIGTFIMSGQADEASAYQELLAVVKDKKIPTKLIVGPEEIDFGGGVTMRFFNPTEDVSGKILHNTNDASLAGRLVFASTSVMLTGDLEKEEEFAADSQGLKSDIYKAGHHGAINANDAEFTKAVAPDYAVISVGLDNPYGHPAYRTLKNLSDIGAEIFRTDQDGDVVFYTDGEKILTE
jgi:competence protein ComEC